MWVVSLDGRNGMRGTRRVAQGGLHGCSVGARDFLRAALAHAASAIVLVHNHPSGDPTPSSEDIAMTRTVADAAELIGHPAPRPRCRGGRRSTCVDAGLGVLP